MRRVVLFSGHMIDAPDRLEPRFRPAAAPIAERAIANKLTELDTGPNDAGISSGACGGDLLFAQACLQRGMPLSIFLPFAEPEFLEKCVTYAGPPWRSVYERIKENPRTRVELPPEGGFDCNENVFEVINLRQIRAAIALGFDQVECLCLWNGLPGDGPGGTHHMVGEVMRVGGRIHRLDARKLL